MLNLLAQSLPESATGWGVLIVLVSGSGIIGVWINNWFHDRGKEREQRGKERESQVSRENAEIERLWKEFREERRVCQEDRQRLEGRIDGLEKRLEAKSQERHDALGQANAWRLKYSGLLNKWNKLVPAYNATKTENVELRKRVESLTTLGDGEKQPSATTSPNTRRRS